MNFQRDIEICSGDSYWCVKVPVGTFDLIKTEVAENCQAQEGLGPLDLGCPSVCQDFALIFKTKTFP